MRFNQTIENRKILPHYRSMSTLDKPKSPRRAARSSSAREILGYSKEGIAILKPALPPKSFTSRQLQKVLRDLGIRDSISKAG